MKPLTRKEMFLNGDNIKPLTRKELILSGEDIKPLTRREYFLKKRQEGGGGNPNRVEVIQGTLAEPWGDVGFVALFEALPFYNDDDSVVGINATAIMLIDGTELGMGTAKLPLHSSADSLYFISGDGFNFVDGGFLAATAVWNHDGIVDANVITGSVQDETYAVTDVTPYASLIPTTLTIIWHPLPEES